VVDKKAVLLLVLQRIAVNFFIVINLKFESFNKRKPTITRTLAKHYKEQYMIIGVPKEIKVHEYRVGMTPASVKELTSAGHSVYIEQSAGEGIACSDQEYIDAGASILKTAEEIFSTAEMIVKVKEPLAVERVLLRPDQLLFTYLHLAPDMAQTEDLIKSKAVCIAYETVTSGNGGLPLLAPMSEVAGRMSIQAGAACLEKQKVIKSYTALLDPQYLDASLLVYIELTLKRSSADVFERFNEAAKKLDSILECHLVSGDFDYLLKTRVADMSAYRKVLSETFLSLPDIKSSKTYVVMEEVKYLTSINIPN